jgi:hypothetical protein
MTNPLITIHNTTTDEIVTREMNAQEFKQYEADQVERVAETKAIKAIKAAKDALLARLGITADEAKLLLG